MRTPWYPTIDELELQARALVAAHPETLGLRTVGESRAGSPLWLLSAGRGERHVLTVSGAHANEPVGGASALRLAGELARAPELLELLDCTWHMLLCLDPDGARLAQGWAPGEADPSLEGYHRHFYRPAFVCQPESLPAQGDGRDPLPESSALVRLLDELRPTVQFSLHGIEFGGAFLQLTRPVPGAAHDFRETAGRLGVPLEHRPYDSVDWDEDGPGVLVLPGARTRGERDASGFVSEMTWTYPLRHGTVTAIVETPSWGLTSVSDGRPAADPGKELARARELLLRRTGQLTDALGAGDTAVPEGLIPIRTAAQELIDVAPSIVGTWDSYAEDPYAQGGLRTVEGHFASLALAARRIPLRAAAMMRRALEVTEPATADALTGLVRAWCRELEETYDPRWVPVAAQTELHVRTMLDLAGKLLVDDGDQAPVTACGPRTGSSRTPRP
ncbi:M14 family zinc carboxypeptidase [Streptomyces sp. NBC_01465]|uniref:M14 family zinc carboxypeptidase n=1 Tax=Streptomyces sp. NBC_01465 TaxID=2903878 RepID=UPI002E35E6C3|nr:M14 family zinc carboxypeptidase [Streptomyces sp. NBC_01465]